MSATASEIRSALKELSTNWTWDLAGLPKPGQQKIELTARSKSKPEKIKVVISNDSSPGESTLMHLVQNAIKPRTPRSDASNTRLSAAKNPHAPKPAQNSDVKSHYELLRKLYKSNLEDVKEKAIRTEEITRGMLWSLL